ncbi:hypothetical protein [Rhizobium halophilum]|uniref:hypothetical protein n=1 Tax=Rhizobium halophilum TaxID=2846852 RepID=UPI001EFD54EB|nr:hypothetical protein [Rhizobium halophilum]MCF6371329.1 hypothetical protein [Rhizobium halophilum]
MQYVQALLRQPLALPIILIGTIAVAASSEQVTLDDGTTCTVIDGVEGETATKSGISSSVTVGGGTVTSSTTINGRTTTTHSGAGTPSSAANTSTSSTGSSATAGSSDGQSFSTASVTKPDGTVITRRSDGTCDITKPKP